MSKIHQLSLHEIQKIAAGEVIDRPANIVKELIENALDAGATHIKTCIEDGGKKLVRVIDNGCGMAPDDAKLCFAHHATSKITSLHDLEHCTTHGFRGEALSSIASVSHITMTTKPEDNQLGTRLILLDGTVTEETAVSANMGTDMSIANLFYNIPARKKFLKTRETEWRQILRLVQAYCLEYRNIHFELFCEGESVINCPPTKTLESRIAQVWDYDMSNAMLPTIIEDPNQHIAIEGVISHHHYARYDRSNIFMFVNHRWIKNQNLMKALLKGYANVLPPARYPAGTISITIEPEQVDINIHPRKEEVKFLHPHTVENLIYECVKKSLEKRLESKIATMPNVRSELHERFIPNENLNTAPSIIKQPCIVPSQIETASIDIQEFKETPRMNDKPKVTQNTSLQASCVNPIPLPIQKVPTHETNLTITDPVVKEFSYGTIIGQYKNTYIMIEGNDGLLLIDQHAAHERILYEQFASRFEEIATVKILFPTIISVTSEDLALVEPHMAVLHEQGILLEPFGKNQLIVSATPVHLQHVNIAELIKQFISLLHADELATDMYQHMTDKLRALMACKAAVKAGDALSIIQMQQIVKDLQYTANKLTCPHGRPTSWLLEHHDIEKKFKRDYRSTPRENLDNI
jgi:DNA mismatch repair protein MutL